MAATLKTNPNFRWLLRGAIVSNLGDQLTIVALPPGDRRAGVRHRTGAGIRHPGRVATSRRSMRWR